MVCARTLICGFGLAAVLGSTGCVVRGHGSVGVRPASVVVYDAPPPPRVETVETRPGFIWIRGRWVWNGGQWTWRDGHWERDRVGYSWSAGQWEQRGNQWVWVEGRWTASSQPAPRPVVDSAPGGVVVGNTPAPPARPDVDSAPGGVVVSGGGQWPTSAPPPSRAVSPPPRTGFVWITGRWDWRLGNWVWIDGHWERERANRQWVAGRWELRGNRWMWIDGRWEARARVKPRGPIVRDHR